MPNLINGRAFSPSVILSEAKDLTPALASLIVPSVISDSIVRFLSRGCGIGMTEQHARANNCGPAAKQ